jgi:hypothetical protein
MKFLQHTFETVRVETRARLQGSSKIQEITSFTFNRKHGPIKD